MKTAKKLVLAAVVLPLTLGTASAWAFGGKDHHKGAKGQCGMGMDRGILRQLDLSDDQKQQLKAMKKEAKAERKEQRAENFAANKAQREAMHDKVQQLLLADTFDEQAANALAKAMAEKHAERRVQKLAFKHKMLSVLTPEQKIKFVELQEERREKCSEKMQRRSDKDAE